MSEEAIPSEVRQFLTDYIDSVVQLEALVLLHNNPSTEWDAQTLSARLYVGAAAAAAQMEELCARGLAASRKESAVLYRYGPRTELARVADAVVGAYARNLVQVATLIHSKPRAPIRHFADAFRWR
ncbi:MAG: hypothetical protein HY013_07065 [Candidatus Solibacter usitatus]|nr:hypothetical protein [Candidatus Solibacter usitatus]